MYINEFDKNAECAKIGKSAEDLFEMYLKKSGKQYRPANLAEQYQHIDFVVHSKRDIRIDVKGPKKVSRSNVNFDSDFIWVEFKNVRGDAGWLYGENDLIAFYHEPDSSFYVVRTPELAQLCEKLCDNKRVFYSNEALYHKYTRSGRKDILSMIKFKDILTIPYNKIKVRRKCQEVEENRI